MKPANKPRFNAGRRPWKTGTARGGYTLVEFIGVVTVLSIFSVILLGVVIKRVDYAAYNAEQSNLATFANALTLQTLRSNTIPAQAGWAAPVAAWLTYSAGSVATNVRHKARVYLIDTNGWLGTVKLPYTNNIGGTAISSSARAMFVSSIGAALPAGLSAGSATDFNNLWNAASGTVPAGGPWSGWAGKPADLLVQRLNFQPLFYQLILVNRDTNNAASFYLNTTNKFTTVTNRSIWNAYYLSGSLVGLSSTNSGAQALQSTFPLTCNCSYVFENGVWNNQIGIGQNTLFTNVPIGSLFNSYASNFVNEPENPNAGGNSSKGGDQQQVLSSMVDFIMAYELWANNPHGRFTTYNINAGTNYDSMYNYLVNAAAMLSQTAGTGKDPNDISGLLQ